MLSTFSTAPTDLTYRAHYLDLRASVRKPIFTSGQIFVSRYIKWKPVYWFLFDTVLSTIGAEVGRERWKVLLLFPFYRWRKKALVKLNNWFEAKTGGSADWDLKLAGMTLELTLLPAVLYCLQLNCPASTWPGPSLPCNSCLQWTSLHSSFLLCTLHNTHSFLIPFCYLTIFSPINMQPKVSPLTEAFLLCFSKK